MARDMPGGKGREMRELCKNNFGTPKNVADVPVCVSRHTPAPQWLNTWAVSRTRTSSRCLRQCSTALSLGILLSAYGVASADESPHYTATFTIDSRLPNCPGEQTFMSMLYSHLRAPLLNPPASRVLRVHVKPGKGEGYSIDVVTENLDGSTIDSEHVDYPRDVCCFQVVYNAAFMAAVQIGAFTPMDPSPVRETETVHCAVAPQPKTPPPAEAPIKPPKPAIASRRPKFQIGTGPVVAIGFTPEIAVGANVGMAARWPRFSLGLDMRPTLPIETQPAGLDIARFTTFSGAFTPCFRPGPFLLCGLLIGGFVWANVVDQPYEETDRMSLFGGGGRVGFELPLIKQWTARMDIDLAIMAARPRATLAGKPNVWTMGTVTGNVGMNLFWTF